MAPGKWEHRHKTQTNDPVPGEPPLQTQLRQNQDHPPGLLSTQKHPVTCSPVFLAPFPPGQVQLQKKYGRDRRPLLLLPTQTQQAGFLAGSSYEGLAHTQIHKAERKKRRAFGDHLLVEFLERSRIWSAGVFISNFQHQEKRSLENLCGGGRFSAGHPLGLRFVPVSTLFWCFILTSAPAMPTRPNLGTVLSSAGVSSPHPLLH